MNQKTIPKNSRLVAKKCFKHPVDRVGLPIYKLIVFDSGIYALMDGVGGIRSCDQNWAKQQQQQQTKERK